MLILQSNFQVIKMQEGNTHTNREVIHDRILEIAAVQFTRIGIRAVRMDDLASLAGISKRTLYEEFADKKTLLRAMMLQKKAEMEKHIHHLVERTDNVLEALFLLFDFNQQMMSQTIPLFFEDLRRYPELIQELRESREVHYGRARGFIQAGMEQGLFRKELNLDLFIRSQALMHEDLFMELKKDFSFYEIFRNIVLVYLRGISTPSGLALIDDFEMELLENKR